MVTPRIGTQIPSSLSSSNLLAARDRAARAVTLARERGLAAPVAVQAEYNLLERTAEHELLPMCAALDVAVLGYSPLAAGRLTGRHRDESDAGRARYAHEQDTRTEAISDAVRRLAGTAGCSGTQLAIAWVRARSRPSVIPVLGASDAAQLTHTLEALDVVPAPELIAELDALSEPPPAFPSAVVRQAIRAQSTAGHHEQVDSHRPWGDGW